LLLRALQRVSFGGVLPAFFLALALPAAAPSSTAFLGVAPAERRAPSP
jgi:hypothetical protein